MKKAVFMVLLVLAFFTSNVFGGTETWYGDKLTHIYGYNKWSCDALLMDSPVYSKIYSNRGEAIRGYVVTPMDPSYNMNVDRSIAPRFWDRGKKTNLAVITVYKVGGLAYFRLNFVKFNDGDQLTFEFISAVEDLDLMYWMRRGSYDKTDSTERVPIAAREVLWAIENDATLIQNNQGGNSIINVWRLPNGRTRRFEHTIAISPIWSSPKDFGATLVRTK